MIAIIDYGLGNLGSIANMCKKLGVRTHVCAEPKQALPATGLILPGVGAFARGMESLKERGFIELLEHKVKAEGVPILGICLGMQLMTQGSEEGGGRGLGWFNARTVRFDFSANKEALKIPHMGWNRVYQNKRSRLFEEMHDDPRFYFVHSYHVVCDDSSDVLATTHYGHDFVSAIERGSMYGVQFHPEKSHKFGMRLMRNFLDTVVAGA